MALVYILVRVLTIVFAVLIPAPLMAIPTSLHSVYACENDLRNITCGKYPGIINIYDVKFTKESANLCGNGNKNVQCEASTEEESCLAWAVGKRCNGKNTCPIHVADGIYDDIQLPCRNLGIDIRVEFTFDCVKKDHVPTLIVTNSKCSTGTTAKPLIETTRRIHTAGEATSTSTVISTSKGATVTDFEPTATTAESSFRKWKRRHPKTCNFTEEHHAIVESNAPGCCSSLVVFLFSFHWLMLEML